MIRTHAVPTHSSPAANPRRLGLDAAVALAAPAHRPAPELEQEAEQAANQVMQASTGLGGGPFQRSATAQGNNLDLSQGEGQALPPAERAFFEPRFGHDFSQVRLHTDTQAAELATTANARALTIGRDIHFGAGQYQPGNPHSQKLLAHELTHTLQQAGQQAGQAGNPAPQRQPLSKKSGIGSAPPEESFIVAEGTGSEDGHVLFPEDQAILGATEQKQLLTLIAPYTSPVTVEVHGYASLEGDPGYNSNLSAHRAVTVKAFLQAHLPAGSEIILYARGETTAFGKLLQNRRVGIDISEGVPAGPFQLPSASLSFKSPLLQPPLLQPPAGLSFGLPPLQSPSLSPPSPPAGPNLFPPVPSLPDLTPRPPFSPPLLPPFRLTLPTPQFGPDWSALQEPFRNRGVTLNDRDARAIQQNWATSYQFFLSIGLSPPLAAKAASKANAFAYDTQLSKENPTLVEQMLKQEQNLLKPGETETRFVVPLITPETLEFIFNRKFTF